MRRKHCRKNQATILVILLLLGFRFQGYAEAAAWQQASPNVLINAVNGLRLAHGLNALSIHPILMQVAQSQADALLATDGAVGHGRPNGMTFTQQLLLLGYPLSGDLSLGGYRSENYIMGYQLTPEQAVEAWQGDEPHTNTMLSPNRSDIGAGVSISSEGTVYLVIDTALSTSSGVPQSDASQYLPGGEASSLNPEDAISQYIVPITKSTAMPNGDVYHKVQYGQTLWGIAIEYGTKIEPIRSLNRLGSDNTVFPNQLLLVKQGATQPPMPPTLQPAIATAGPEVEATYDAKMFGPVTTPTLIEAIPAADDMEGGQGPVFSIWLAVIVLLLVAGGVSAVWFIRDPNQ